ncbi:hypothetical protein CUR178_00080 [Leishmania enriettii]|uniref:Calpain catalytic domain-containing protein n=1 Tax=Leishmania enriettii TaxID=5663 RepID=A0A836GDP1_LEIEN|nr:hypothetical protein CUR178_00080 [Leishmania enriettii]
MYRPGVEYWASTGAVVRPSRTTPSPGSPPVTRASATDYYEPCGDASSPLMSTLPPSPLQAPPPPSVSTSGCRNGDGANVSDSKHSMQQQRERQLREDEAARLEATLERERADRAKLLKSFQGSLQREHLLRTTAEQRRQTALVEGEQLRTALRALLSQSSGDNSTGSWLSTVPLSLYEEARRLLLQCKRTFEELKALQLRATGPAGLELFRRYDIPRLDKIPPAWPPGTPQGVDQEEQEHARGAESVDSHPHSTSAAHEKVTAGTPLVVMEETPTGPEISALTAVSLDTTCSVSSATQQHHVVTSAGRAAQPWHEYGDASLADTSSNGAGAGDVGGELFSTDSRRRPRSAFLTPPPPSPTLNTDNAVQVWAGPMQKITQPTTLDPATAPRLDTHSGTEHSESEVEGMIRDADRHHRQLARAIAALATSQGLRTASEVAALCHRRGLKYIDAAFLPVSETLGLGSSGGCRGYDPRRGTSFVVQWQPRDAAVPPDRKSELLTSAGIDPRSLRCGPLGDYGVAAALAALAEASGAVASMFSSTTEEDEENGLYTVWLCVHGWWTRVTVDAYLPCIIEQNRPVALYGCSSTTTYDLWSPVCEKALAKVLCGYHSLGSLTADTAMGYFTGGPVECWDWWHARSGAALEEMRAVLDTSARGAGVVLLSTFATAVRRDTSPMSLTVAGAQAAYVRLGLRPGTSYRVLAVADNADGEPMLLLRNWTQPREQHLDSQACCLSDLDPADCGDRHNVSPRQDSSGGAVAAKGWLTKPPSPPMCGTSHDDSCVWLSYAKEVLPYFDGCHACFDCRRYHDLRIPIAFCGSRPAIPAQLVRVRVQEGPARPPHGVSCPPTRLWIGLHQPCCRSASDSAASDAFPWGLKMTLVGNEEAPAPFRRNGSCVRPVGRSYLLSESFLGEPKELPAVWMYLELDAVADRAPHLVTNLKDEDAAAPSTTIEFFVVPQLERVVRMDRAYTGDDDDGLGSLGFSAPTLRRRRGVAEDRQRSHLRTDVVPSVEQSGGASDVEIALWQQRRTNHPASAAGHLFGNTTTAIVAVLAEHRDSVVVDVVDAPEELRAAVYHDVFDHIDFSDCALAGGCGHRHASRLSQAGAASVVGETRCQLNGRCMPTFSW